MRSQSPVSLHAPLRAVNVGAPQPLGLWRGQTVESGIRKTSVTADTIALSATNLAGDRQADLTVHGGVDKAVYAYCTAHWAWWATHAGLACASGTFGENLTLDEVTEDHVRIGDVFAWGTARLAVSQPRQPCFKLALHLGRQDIGALMIKTARCGFYLRVLEGGVVPVKPAALERTETNAGAPTVRALFQQFYDPHTTSAALLALAATPGLAAAWRVALTEKSAARAIK